MQKYKPPLHIIVAVWVTCGLGIYGIKAWYFAERSTWLLVVPVSIIGFVLGVRMWRRVRHLYVTRRGRLAAPLIVLLVSACLSVAAGLGLPALILRMMGPDTQISAAVLRKEHGGRRCRTQVYLAEYWPSRRCVSARDHEWIQDGRRVVLNVRSSVFGTFVFSIEPG
jgi:hypothetical protein